MRRTDEFEVRAQQREPEPRITLAHRNDGATLKIDVAALRAQYLLPLGDILLILDEECPFEEQLHLALVRDGQLLDHLVIGAPYAPGAYREVEVKGSELRFRFEGDAIWTLTARAQGARGRVALPPGAKRRGGWLSPRHLLVSQEQVG